MTRNVIISAKRAAVAPGRKSGIRQLLQRLRSIVFGQMRFSRVDGQIKVTCGADAAPAAMASAANSTPATAAVPKKPTPRDRAFSLMVGELSISLSANPRNRTNMRYLVRLEAALIATGIDALGEIPLIHGRKARKQLDILMAVAPSPGLQDLAARLDVAIMIRDVDVHSGPDAGPTDFGTYAGPRSAVGPDSGFQIGGVRL